MTGIRASGLTCGTVYVLARSTVAHTAHGLLSASVRYVIKRGHFATDGPRLAAMTRAARETRARPAPSAVHCAERRVFVRSEKSNALVGDGVPQPAPRSANLDSAFGGMQLLATEAWRAAPLLLTRSAQLAQPTVRLP